MRPTEPTPLAKSNNRRARPCGFCRKKAAERVVVREAVALLELCYTPIRRQGVPDALYAAAAASSVAKRFVGTSTQFCTVGKGAGICVMRLQRFGGPAATSDAAVRVRAVLLSEL